MAKVIILNYGAGCVETAIIPDSLDDSEQIESYLQLEFDYRMDEISYMVHDSDICPVFKAGELATKVFI